jgi:hypothetical protein
MSYTADEVLEAIKNLFPARETKFMSFNSTNQFCGALEAHEPIEFPLGEVKLISEYGGEDQGSQYGFVFSLGEQFFDLRVTYDSWDGVDYDYPTVTEVRPKEITTTIYVSV